MSRKQDYSKKILRILAKKSAISLPALTETVREQAGLPELSEKGGPECLPEVADPKYKYAIARSLKGLREAGLVEQIRSSQTEFARLTREGRKKVHSLGLENQLLSTAWDGQWRIILLDLPEERKNERESLRYLLKKAGFVCLKNSAWISPFPYDHLFANIKKDLGLTTELMIIVTDNIDDETKKFLFESFGS